MDRTFSRRAMMAAAAAAASLGVPFLARAQAYPEKGKVIKAISPFSAGSSPDTLARAYAQAISEIVGTSVVVENRPGGESVIGLQAAKMAPPDGYTMLFTSLSTQVVNPHLFKQLAYEPLKDFIPLAGTLKVTLAMFVGPSMAQYKSAKEFVEAARANPGKFTYASGSATTRLAGEMIAKAANIKMVNVPYRNIAEIFGDMIGGRVDFFVTDLPTATPFTKQGVRALAVAGPARLAAIPDVPTFEEQGIPGVSVVGWHGAYLPANTPPAVVATLRDAVRQSTKSKVVKDYYATFGVEPLELAGEEFAAFQRSEFERWGRAVRDAGMQGTL